MLGPLGPRSDQHALPGRVFLVIQKEGTVTGTGHVGRRERVPLTEAEQQSQRERSSGLENLEYSGRRPSLRSQVTETGNGQHDPLAAAD